MTHSEILNFDELSMPDKAAVRAGARLNQNEIAAMRQIVSEHEVQDAPRDRCTFFQEGMAWHTIRMSLLYIKEFSNARHIHKAIKCTLLQWYLMLLVLV